MGKDPLNNELSILAELTSAGVVAKAKMRTLSAIDRFLGNVVDGWNVLREVRIAEARAESDAKIKLIEAAGDAAAAHLRSSPDVAIRAIENQFSSSFRRQENKESVLLSAIEDLRLNPPNEEQANQGPDTLDEDFLNRFERFAEDASSEKIRLKWSKVLSAEIRRPGTVSAKTMRVVDETPHETALIFNRVCSHRMNKGIVKCISGDLPFDEINKLVQSELVVDPTVSGHYMGFVRSYNSYKIESWTFQYNGGLVALPIDIDLSRLWGAGSQQPLARSSDGSPAIPVYILTDAGHALSLVMDSNECATFDSYLVLLSAFLPDVEIDEFRSSGDGQFTFLKTHNQK